MAMKDFCYWVRRPSFTFAVDFRFPQGREVEGSGTSMGGNLTSGGVSLRLIEADRREVARL